MTGRTDGPVVVLAHGCGCDQNIGRPAVSPPDPGFFTDDPATGYRDGFSAEDREANGSRLIALDAGGHRPQLAAPEETAVSIAAFDGAGR
ncbi:hypothetical protein ACFV06_13860 [Streptomyces sp. NPDC059618]|uniref:hypothetical protein n=1 Tax=Streptomyces sp. NPDC059618 TaxID=3346887 RepID=UPI0036C6A876